jgi:hypothetical protein
LNWACAFSCSTLPNVSGNENCGKMKWLNLIYMDLNKKNLLARAQIKKIANSFHADLTSNLKNPKFKKDFYDNLLKYRIANEIINFRKKRGVTQEELAKK